VANRIKLGLEQFSPEDRDKAIIMFSAHSVPMKTVYKGDSYTTEIASTVQHVMKELGVKNSYILSWQSKGTCKWICPCCTRHFAHAVVSILPLNSRLPALDGAEHERHDQGFWRAGKEVRHSRSVCAILLSMLLTCIHDCAPCRHVLAVPIAFTSDHIETLFEIDVEYAHEAEQAGITVRLKNPTKLLAMPPLVLTLICHFTTAIQAFAVAERRAAAVRGDGRPDQEPPGLGGAALAAVSAQLPWLHQPYVPEHAEPHQALPQAPLKRLYRFLMLQALAWQSGPSPLATCKETDLIPH